MICGAFGFTGRTTSKRAYFSQAAFLNDLTGIMIGLKRSGWASPPLCRCDAIDDGGMGSGGGRGRGFKALALFRPQLHGGTSARGKRHQADRAAPDELRLQLPSGTQTRAPLTGSRIVFVCPRRLSARIWWRQQSVGKVFVMFTVAANDLKRVNTCVMYERVCSMGGREDLL